MKKTVHYDASKGAIVKVGKPAMVFPVDHTSPFVSNTKAIFTSNVQSLDKKTGIFETLNSIYKPL